MVSLLAPTLTASHTILLPHPRRQYRRCKQLSQARVTSATATPAVVQFSKEDLQSVQKSLQIFGKAFEDDLLAVYLMPGADSAARGEGVSSYVEYQLGTTSNADLLFRNEDTSAAAFCYQIPDQLAVPATEQLPSEEEAKEDRFQLLDIVFANGRRDFLKAHGPFIMISFLGVHPSKQRRGLGGQLLTMICTVADREQKWLYLEASTEQSAALYAKHGFVVSFTSQLGPDAPTIRHMGRPPQ